jgi:spore maturation protein CgeD
MKITCILTSYNRPKLIRQSLKSLENQTYRDFEVLLHDSSTLMDIDDVVKDFRIPGLCVIRRVTSTEERKGNELGIKINVGIRRSTGDLLCYLCDDDFFYPTWFEDAVKFFKANPDKAAGFGKLRYTNSMEMVFPDRGDIRFFDKPVADPFCNLDHNQVIHRRSDPPYFWPETRETMTEPDGHFFREIARNHVFHPIDAFAAVKRMHNKNLQAKVEDFRQGQADNLRE